MNNEVLQSLKTNGAAIKDQVKKLFEDTINTKEQNPLNGFDEKFSGIFKSYSIPINIRLLMDPATGSVSINPTDNDSKEVLNYCQTNGIL